MNHDKVNNQYIMTCWTKYTWSFSSFSLSWVKLGFLVRLSAGALIIYPHIMSDKHSLTSVLATFYRNEDSSSGYSRTQPGRQFSLQRSRHWKLSCHNSSLPGSSTVRIFQKLFSQNNIFLWTSLGRSRHFSLLVRRSPWHADQEYCWFHFECFWFYERIFLQSLVCDTWKWSWMRF